MEKGNIIIILLIGCLVASPGCNFQSTKGYDSNAGNKDTLIEHQQSTLRVSESVLDSITDSTDIVDIPLDDDDLVGILVDAVYRQDNINEMKPLLFQTLKTLNPSNLSTERKCDLVIFCIYCAEALSDLKNSTIESDHKDYEELIRTIETDYAILTVRTLEMIQSELNNEQIILRVARHLEELSGRPAEIAQSGLSVIFEVKKTIEKAANPIRGSVLYDAYYRNEISAEQDYPVGYEYFVTFRVVRVLRDNDEEYEYYIQSTLADLYSDDPNFLKINYPADVVIKGILIGRCRNGDLKFVNVELIKNL